MEIGKVMFYSMQSSDYDFFDICRIFAYISETIGHIKIWFGQSTFQALNT